MRFVMFAVAVVAAATLSGCGDIPRSRVHGVVKLHGKPLTNATIIFIASDNKTHLCSLKSDGSFEVEGVAQGHVKVSIQQDLPKVTPRPAPSASSGSKGVYDEKARATRPPTSSIVDIDNPLPSIYTDPERSGLAFELKESDQEWSIDLK